VLAGYALWSHFGEAAKPTMRAMVPSGRVMRNISRQILRLLRPLANQLSGGAQARGNLACAIFEHCCGFITARDV
jgi:hypothetical protein